MGFVHRALQDFNQRSVDGLLPSVVVVPITVEGEKQDVWISWTDVDGYDGLAGGWRAGKGKVVKRKRRAWWRCVYLAGEKYLTGIVLV